MFRYTMEIKSVKSKIQLGASNRILIEELDQRSQLVNVTTTAATTTFYIIFMSIIIFIIILIIWLVKRNYYNRHV